MFGLPSPSKLLVLVVVILVVWHGFKWIGRAQNKRSPGKANGKIRIVADVPAYFIKNLFRFAVRWKGSVEGLDGDRPIGVPVRVEARRDLRHDRTRGEQAEVTVVVVGRDAEVDVADVATPDDRDLVVDRKDLVVHAVLQPSRAGHEFKIARERTPPASQRVEDANLDIRMARYRCDREVALAAKVEVVEEQTHPDAALRGPQKPLAEPATAAVPLPDVVLHVDAVLGDVRQHNARPEGVLTGIEQAESRAPWVAGERIREKAPEGRLAALRLGNRPALWRAVADRSSRTTGCDDEERRRDGEGESP